MQQNQGLGQVIEAPFPRDIQVIPTGRRRIEVDFEVFFSEEMAQVSTLAAKVYVALASCIRRSTMTWFATVREISALVRKSKSHTQRCLTELVEAGLVHRCVRRFRHRSGAVHQLENRWVFTLPASLKEEGQVPLLEPRPDPLALSPVPSEPEPVPMPVASAQTEPNREAGVDGLLENDGFEHSLSESGGSEASDFGLEEEPEPELQEGLPPPPHI